MKNSFSLECSFGNLNVSLPGDNDVWRTSVCVKEISQGVSEIILTLDAETLSAPPRTRIAWSVPQDDIACRWYASSDRRANMPANWCSQLASQLAFSAPVLVLHSQSGRNRMSFAFSEAMREISFGAGVNEFSAELDCFVSLFENPEAPLEHYSAKLLVLTEDIFYSDAVRKLFDWFGAMKEYSVAPAPASAFDLLYSSWYSYHKNFLYAETLEKELVLASELGMKNVIVDDGWQTDDYTGGPYSHCGDWRPVPTHFPDMKKHVERVHALGMKYILWYSVPFVGALSENYERFKGKYLYSRMSDAYVLDPRFPEVREFLINTYENAVKDWDLDGFKLDFIDSFPVSWASDPAVAEDFANRDCKTVSEGVDKLMTSVMKRLRALKSDILIEFRQNYTGPAIRKYGNMLRAADCPGDILMNRVRTLDLRITASGRTAVHADMLEWHKAETPANAARQFLAVLFSVPQISVRIEELSPEHRQMLAFWLGFWRGHRDLLLNGHLTPYHPELNYPLVRTVLNGEELFAVYSGGQSFAVMNEEKTYIVNASCDETLILDVLHACECTVFDTCGTQLSSSSLEKGLVRVGIPCSGVAVLCVK